MSDMNARTGKKLKHDIIESFGEDIVNENEQRTIEICTQFIFIYQGIECGSEHYILKAQIEIFFKSKTPDTGGYKTN